MKLQKSKPVISSSTCYLFVLDFQKLLSSSPQVGFVVLVFFFTSGLIHVFFFFMVFLSFLISFAFLLCEQLNEGGDGGV